MNLAIEMIEKKLSQNLNSIMKKYPKFLTQKKKKNKTKQNKTKTELSKERLTQKFGQMDSLVSNFMFEQILLLIKEYRLHGIKHQTKAITK